MLKYLFLSAAALTALAGPAFGAAQTAQSIGVKLTGAGDYMIGGTATYQFNPATAATFYTNKLDSPTPLIAVCVSLVGGSCTTSQPSATAPLPDPG